MQITEYAWVLCDALCAATWSLSALSRSAAARLLSLAITSCSMLSYMHCAMARRSRTAVLDMRPSNSRTLA